MLVPLVQRSFSIFVVRLRNIVTHIATAKMTDIICMMTTILPTFLPIRLYFLPLVCCIFFILIAPSVMIS